MEDVCISQMDYDWLQITTMVGAAAEGLLTSAVPGEERFHGTIDTVKAI